MPVAPMAAGRDGRPALQTQPVGAAMNAQFDASMRA